VLCDLYPWRSQTALKINDRPASEHPAAGKTMMISIAKLPKRKRARLARRRHGNLGS